jgi:AraC family transcriptional regulator, transcriptional activator of pobA
MEKIETIEEFYKRKFDLMPDNIRNEIGHFNVFRSEPFVGNKAKPVSYKRRDYFKILLVTDNSQVHYADKVVEVKTQQRECI